MKKTLTINLSGIVFNIDEDAYEVLQQYLRKLEISFADEDGKEIMRDIEARLAELFSNALKHSNSSVVTINEVDSAIEQLGTAEEIDSESNSYDQEEAKPKTAVREKRNSNKYLEHLNNKGFAIDTEVTSGANVAIYNGNVLEYELEFKKLPLFLTIDAKSVNENAKISYNNIRAKI